MVEKNEYTAVNMLIKTNRMHKKLLDSNVCTKIGLHRTQHIILMHLAGREKLPSQKELAERLDVSDKTISKWETGRGLPDISLLAPLAEALGISLTELFTGEKTINRNLSGNMQRSIFYVCPVCGNVIHCMGEVTLSCCGIELPPLEAETCDAEHEITVDLSDGGYYVHMNHPMTREHYISYLAAVTDQGMEIIKLYPEGNAEARFKTSRVKWIYACCNRHGLYRLSLRPRRR